MSQVIIGIDIAKLKFDVARLCGGKYKHAKFANDTEGFAAFVAWLNRFADTDLRTCMEATGAYSLALAEFLTDSGYFVGIINPAQIHAYGKSERRESLFLRKLVLGIPAQASCKNLTRPPMPSAARIRPRFATMHNSPPVRRASRLPK